MAFDDVADPTRQLTDPAERTETILGQPFSNFAAALDWLSPSRIVNEFIKQACGYDTRHALTRMLRWEQRCRSIGVPPSGPAKTALSRRSGSAWVPQKRTSDGYENLFGQPKRVIATNSMYRRICEMQIGIGYPRIDTRLLLSANLHLTMRGREVVMALTTGTSADGHGQEIIYYRGPRIIVTSRFIENAASRYPVRELDDFRRVLRNSHSARNAALVCGAVEWGIAAPLAAVTYGSMILMLAGALTATGIVVAHVADGRRNPRWMELRAAHGGRVVTIFSSPTHREFEQVRRAVIRAAAANEKLFP